MIQTKRGIYSLQAGQGEATDRSIGPARGRRTPEK